MWNILLIHVLSFHEVNCQELQYYLYPHLVDGHPGDEPRCLEDEDGGDGDSARNAKRLKAGQDLEGYVKCDFSLNASQKGFVKSRLNFA